MSFFSQTAIQVAITQLSVPIAPPLNVQNALEQIVAGTVGLPWTAASSTAAPNNVVAAVSFTPTSGVITDADAVIAPLGTGALLADIPDSTAVGGNKRGTFAVDLQLQRTNAGEVAMGQGSALVGGDTNTANGANSGILAGQGNQASGTHAFIGAGQTCLAAGNHSAVFGLSNTATSAASRSFVGGGTLNAVSTADSGAVAGSSNTVTGTAARSATIGGNTNTVTDAVNACIAGGASNQVSSSAGAAAFIGGGVSHNVSGLQGAAVGGSTHIVSGPNSIVAGGANGTASGLRSAVVGGLTSVASNTGSGVFAGSSNTASGNTSAVVAGSTNTSSGTRSACLAGNTNTASGTESASIGGFTNSVSGTRAVALGGSNAVMPLHSACAQGAVAVTPGLALQTILMTSRALAPAIGVAVPLTSTGAAADATNQLTLPDNTSMSFRALVTVRDPATGDSQCWDVIGAIKRGAGAATTALVGVAVVTQVASDAAIVGTVVNAVADVVNGALQVTVTPSVANMQATMSMQGCQTTA